VPVIVFMMLIFDRLKQWQLEYVLSISYYKHHRNDCTDHCLPWHGRTKRFDFLILNRFPSPEICGWSFQLFDVGFFVRRIAEVHKSVKPCREGDDGSKMTEPKKAVFPVITSGSRFADSAEGSIRASTMYKTII
jgi:hypothetical protein